MKALILLYALAAPVLAAVLVWGLVHLPLEALLVAVPILCGFGIAATLGKPGNCPGPF